MKVQVGQVWKQERTGEVFLVTRIFTEGITTYALMRKTGAENEPRIRVRVEGNREGQRPVGFSQPHGADEK